MKKNIEFTEINNDFYEELENTAIKLAAAERDLVIYTDGLGALERRLMVEADNLFYEKYKKRLSEALQRRDARAREEYTRMIRATATAQEQKTLLRCRYDMLKMKFEAWRTRSANKRGSA